MSEGHIYAALAKEIHLSQHESGQQFVVFVGDAPDGSGEWRVAAPLAELTRTSGMFAAAMATGVAVDTDSNYTGP